MDAIYGMKTLADHSVDMILCDLPYAVTKNDWDILIPFDELWAQYRRLIKPTGAIVLTANNGFTFQLEQSNPGWYRYKWVWVKNTATNFVNAQRRPMSAYEEVLVFSPSKLGKMHYYPQGLVRVNKRQAKGTKIHGSYLQEFSNYPSDVLKVNSEQHGWHPTQKPVELFNYLIRTYTQPGELVLDNCMGSGTTAIACIDTQRHYIGFEKNENYWQRSLQRINEHHTAEIDFFSD